MIRYDDFEYVKIDKDASVLVATLNRPEKMNALRRSDHREVTRLLRRFAEDVEMRVLVIRGAGRAFCAGGDYELVEAATTDNAALIENLEDGRDLVHAHLDLDKPVVAVVHGQTSGAGAILALLSDFIIAERSLRLCDGHVALGMAAGDGGVLIWPAAMGIVRAKRYLMTGDYVDPEDALALGLITELVEEGEGFDRAMEWAKRLALLPSHAIAFTKRNLNGLIRDRLPLFEAGLAQEMLTLAQPTVATLLNDARTRPNS